MHACFRLFIIGAFVSFPFASLAQAPHGQPSRVRDATARADSELSRYSRCTVTRETYYPQVQVPTLPCVLPQVDRSIIQGPLTGPITRPITGPVTGPIGSRLDQSGHVQ